MQSCLGIYIEDNLVKYAKVRKDKDDVKVEAFNIEFYEDLTEMLKKIVSETNSFKVPISINVSNELYNYFDIFTMLSKKDIKKSVDIEFEMICNEKSYNINSLETRFILMKNKENQDKYKALHISVNKSDINSKMQYFKDCKIVSLAPISTSITNLIDVGEKDNIAIINIEDETRITTIIEGQIFRVDVLQEGMGRILSEINKTENSMKKSYEVCKNITIYTQDNQNSSAEGNEHLEDIMPILYKIVTESKKIIDTSLTTIDKVYITGLGTAINNIDLYFQDYMVNLKCEVLKPFFAESSSIKIPIKEYIEVNSAIALALDGLGYSGKELNFLDKPVNVRGDSAKVNMKTPIKGIEMPHLSGSLSGPLDIIEKLMVRIGVAAFILIVGFVGYSNSINHLITDSETKIQEVSVQTQNQLKLMDDDLAKINTATNYYSKIIDSYNALSKKQEVTEESRIIEKDAIPNMLNKIMFLIPQKVKITSIKNTEKKHIVIEAESEKYEQLGYFTSILKTENVLTDIKSTSGSKNGTVVKVTIEGDLP